MKKVTKYILGSKNGQHSITCTTCNRTSYNANDIKYKFCGGCNKFNDYKLGDMGEMPDFKEIDIKGNILQQQLSKAIKDAYSRYNEKLETYIKSNIIQYYGEMADDEFVKFVKERLTRVTFNYSKEVHYYVDFVDSLNPGFMVGITLENESSITNKGFGFNISIG